MIVAITEGVPVMDMLKVKNYMAAKPCRLIGPNCPGIITVGDEECVDACPAQVYEMVDGKSEPVNMDECLGCETCVEVCPEGAITVTEV